MVAFSNCIAVGIQRRRRNSVVKYWNRLPLAVASVQDHLAFKRQLDTYIYPQILILSLSSHQYGLFWALSPFPIIKYMHTYTNVGVPQEAILSPSLFSLHTDSLAWCHSRLLKYADDFVLCNSFNKCSEHQGLNNDLHRLLTWSADHGLFKNKSKCV